MNKKLQIFVSSTYTDLIEERQAAVEAILEAGHIPAGMELFKAGKSQMKTIKKWIDESDVYMLILGGRYGSIETESGLSYTELEYRYALSKNMPVFAIVLEDSFLFTKAAFHSKDFIFEKDNIEKYEAFKLLVMSKIIKKVNNIDSIEVTVHSTLNDIQYDEDYTLSGWVKSTAINNDPKLINRINFLETENKNLKSQISSPNNKIIGRFTTSELISILSSINLWEKLIYLFGEPSDDILNEIKNFDLYQANALDYFYAMFSYLALGMPHSLFNNNEIDEDVLTMILECAGILVSCDLMVITENNDIILTDIAKKFYAQLLLSNYTPTVNLLHSLIELTMYNLE
ncbi:MAG: DUF4062 domain-containing protein [Lachnospiraceae bacterium]|nr:DUF4062 domain-containing protein [Lachnospiraceae bacterium]